LQIDDLRGLFPREDLRNDLVDVGGHLIVRWRRQLSTMWPASTRGADCRNRFDAQSAARGNALALRASDPTQGALKARLETASLVNDAAASWGIIDIAGVQKLPKASV
jgi:hypothetical protein